MACLTAKTIPGRLSPTALSDRHNAITLIVFAACAEIHAVVDRFSLRPNTIRAKLADFHCQAQLLIRSSEVKLQTEYQVLCREGLRKYNAGSNTAAVYDLIVQLFKLLLMFEFFIRQKLKQVCNRSRRNFLGQRSILLHRGLLPAKRIT